MVGIVIVSHSHRIAEGVVELAREMGGPEVALEAAGGLDLPDRPIGTDAVMVQAAIDRAWSPDGVLVLMDLGSAVLSAEMALELLVDDRRTNVLLCEAPLVEGAVAAAVTAKMGASLDAVAAEARGGLAGKIAHLGAEEPKTGTPGEAAPVADGTRALRLTVRNPHGLHARPAARFVQTVSTFDARVAVRDLTNGRGPAAAASLNAVATLGVTTGHEIEVTASGPQAQQVLAAIRALAARDFDEAADEEAAPAQPSRRPEAAPARDRAGVLLGLPASGGIAIGRARRFHAAQMTAPVGDASDAEAEDAALESALARTADDIRRQREEVAARAGETRAEIFDAHALFLRDETLLEPAHRAIHEHHRTAAQAWREAVEAIVSRWEELDDAYQRARAEDLRSVGMQVLARLLGVDAPGPSLTAPGILIAENLTPADTSGLDPSVVLGIATAHGGPTSHAAVLARSLGIPAVVGVGEGLEAVDEGIPMALNGDTGEVHLAPDPSVVARLRAEGERREATLGAARAAAGAPAITVDGAVIEVSANVGAPGEVAASVAAGADGVGLFRTEFLFMGRDSMPDEDEQEAAYREAAEALDGRPLLLRTLDAGADKPIPYLDQVPEPNPFLGIRGIRLGLRRPLVLETQLRAILRVAADHRVRVMFPMIATLDELRAARATVERARAALGSSAPLEVGIMVEVPAAALTAGALSAEADFLSIGTNDLTQYALAADRGNERIADLNDALHPAVLRLIMAAVEGARAHGRWVGVCGELAGDAAAASLLLGLGVTELSMSAPSIASVKEAIRATDLTAARQLAGRALACATSTEVRSLLAVDRTGAATMRPTP